MEAFILSLIPFYTMITKTKKGNTTQAIIAGAFDLLGFLPFIDKGAQAGGRFSIAIREAAINGTRAELKQAAFKQALREGASSLLKLVFLI